LESSNRSIPLAFEPTNIMSVAWDDAHLRFREPLKAVARRNSVRPISPRIAPMCTRSCSRSAKGGDPSAGTCSGVSSGNGIAVAHFADGRAAEADIVVGADGINSAVQESLFGVQAARFTQQMAWRCIVPIDHVPTQVGPGKS